MHSKSDFNNLLVSAIITTHNRYNLLKRAVKSVFDQTYENIELIVVDDGSDDETKEWCLTQNLKYIYIPKNESKGGNYARNLGIKHSKGEYVAFLDDDDYWLPEKISKQIELLIKCDCELVHGGRRLEIINSDGSISFKNILPYVGHGGDMSKRILQTICCTTSTICVKRKALIDVGLFDENLKFWQEYELTIRLAQRKPFFYVNEPVTVYRVDYSDSNRLTNKYNSWKEAVNYIRTKHIDLYNRQNKIEKFQTKILILNDAKKRAKSSKLYYTYYRLLLITNIIKICIAPIVRIKRNLTLLNNKFK